ncbi:hypothetical protein [Metamycoplasma hominis]
MNEFKSFLMHQNLSKNTIDSYITSAEYYFKNFGEISKQNLLAFKAILVDKYRGKTVNLRIQGINKYLEFISKERLKLKFIKVQAKTYLENVISDADYEFLKNNVTKSIIVHKSTLSLEKKYCFWFLILVCFSLATFINIPNYHYNYNF